jgi:hypothetical protein
MALQLIENAEGDALHLHGDPAHVEGGLCPDVASCRHKGLPPRIILPFC